MKMTLWVEFIGLSYTWFNQTSVIAVFERSDGVVTNQQ